MIRRPDSLRACGTPALNATLKRELERLDADRLPLQQGLSTSSYALDDKLSVIVLGASEEAGRVRARAGIFCAGIIAGCNCADDPTPVDEHVEYCEIQVDIYPATGEASITLLAD